MLGSNVEFKRASNPFRLHDPLPGCDSAIHQIYHEKNQKIAHKTGEFVVNYALRFDHVEWHDITPDTRPFLGRGGRCGFKALIRATYGQFPDHAARVAYHF